MGRDNMIIISDKIQQLRGIGTEYLVDADGQVIAMFINGDMPKAVEAANGDEVTLKAA